MQVTRNIVELPVPVNEVALQDPSQPIPGFVMPEALQLDDILAQIFIRELEDYPLNPPEKNPFLALHLVSTQWNKIMSSPTIHQFLRSQPKSALHLLTKEGMEGVSTDNNLDLVKCCRPLLTKAELSRILLHAEDLETMFFCSAQAAMLQISREDFEAGWTSITSYLDMDIPVYQRNNEEQSKKIERIIKPHRTASHDQSLLFTMPQFSYISLLFLDDLRRPTHFSWPFNLVLENFCYNYHHHPESHGVLANWIAPLKHAVLPNVQRSLVWECLALPLIYAAFARDRKFFDLVDFDVHFWVEFYKNDRREDETRELLLILQDILFGRIKYPYGLAMTAIESVLSERISYGLLGWSKEDLKDTLGTLPIESASVRRSVNELFQS